MNAVLPSKNEQKRKKKKNDNRKLRSNLSGALLPQKRLQ